MIIHSTLCLSASKVVCYTHCARMEPEYNTYSCHLFIEHEKCVLFGVCALQTSSPPSNMIWRNRNNVLVLLANRRNCYRVQPVLSLLSKYAETILVQDRYGFNHWVLDTLIKINVM